MDNEFFKQLGSMGIGGSLAAFAIWLLNKAWKEHAQARVDDATRYQEKILAIHEIEKGRTDLLVNVVKEVSVNIAKNTVMTEAVHRRLDKDAQENK